MLQDTFLLFCENAEIKILEKSSVQYGIKYKLSHNGEEAYMTLYNNGHSLPQGSSNSSFLRLLHTWSNTRPGNRNLSDEEKQQIAMLGMPNFYLSWREWYEDADIIKKHIEQFGEPDEVSASDEYKMHREIMFHDYMFKQATDLSISVDAVRHIIKSWVSRFCFMNIDAESLAYNLICRMKKNTIEDSTDEYVSFYDVIEEMPYVFTRFCHDKRWFAINM